MKRHQAPGLNETRQHAVRHGDAEHGNSKPLQLCDKGRHAVISGEPVEDRLCQRVGRATGNAGRHQAEQPRTKNIMAPPLTRREKPDMHQCMNEPVHRRLRQLGSLADIGKGKPAWWRMRDRIEHKRITAEDCTPSMRKTTRTPWQLRHLQLDFDKEVLSQKNAFGTKYMSR